MPERTFVGFGFGAIQGGLCLYEAFQSGSFKRLVVSEIMPEIVAAIRRHNGAYHVNIATLGGIRRQKVAGIEIFNPTVPAEREQLISAVAEAQEISTALPSVAFYRSGDAADVASILAAGLDRKARDGGPRAVIYTAENNNRAAEILEEEIRSKTGGNPAAGAFCQCLNTVIGKMSGVIADAAQIAEQKLDPITPSSRRAFLVEEFNRILITRIKDREFQRGITVFQEKDDLLPFEEAKLYGHNATHALIGYLLLRKGARRISDARADPGLMQTARSAFLDESGKALCAKWRGIDPLFTPEGYRLYADDLIERMVNPFLGDTVERITRDPRRKLGWNDRFAGTLRMAMAGGLVPVRFASGARAALDLLMKESVGDPGDVLDRIWQEEGADPAQKEKVKALILAS